jgi:outer membrane biosynthesis protein TonB
MLRYLIIIAALFACVYVAVHARWITKPAFLDSVIDDVESEIKEAVEKAPTPPVSEEAPPASSPAPATVAEPAPSVTPEKAAEPAAASPTPAPKAAQGHHAPRAKKTTKPH